jgi:hypothetical protein
MITQKGGSAENRRIHLEKASDDHEKIEERAKERVLCISCSRIARSVIRPASTTIGSVVLSCREVLLGL